MTPEITEPGLYPELAVDEYHADPVPVGSLSSTGARRLLPPSCPALFKWYAENPAPAKATFEEGHAAHKMVLGAGPELVLVDRERWDTNAVKAEVAEIRERGAVPLKRAVLDQVEAMAAALRAHPIAGKLLEPGSGVPEQSLFWLDGPTGVMRRGRLDWLPHGNDGRRLIVPDYKTTKAGDLDSVQKALYNYGYHQQADWYLDGVRALGLAADDAAFVFVFQEKTEPYLVTVVEPDTTALRIGRARNRQALEIYAECKASGVWPGYSSEVELVGLPYWAEARELEEIA